VCVGGDQTQGLAQQALDHWAIFPGSPSVLNHSI
jgi:hypothetical protein